MGKTMFVRSAMDFTMWVSRNNLVYDTEGGTWVRKVDDEYVTVADNLHTLYDRWRLETGQIPRYLVRPSDHHVFEIDPSNCRYRSATLRDDPNRPFAYLHFTYDVLTDNYGFFPIREDQLDEYLTMDEELNLAYNEHLSHGISYGCTIQEFAAMKRDPNKYRDEAVNRYRSDRE